MDADENLRNLKANAYPKVSSATTCSAQSLPQKVSPTNIFSQQSTQFDSKPATARYSTSNSVFSEIVRTQCSNSIIFFLFFRQNQWLTDPII